MFIFRLKIFQFTNIQDVTLIRVVLGKHEKWIGWEPPLKTNLKLRKWGSGLRGEDGISVDCGGPDWAEPECNGLGQSGPDPSKLRWAGVESIGSARTVLCLKTVWRARTYGLGLENIAPSAQRSLLPKIFVVHKRYLSCVSIMCFACCDFACFFMCFCFMSFFSFLYMCVLCFFTLY